MPDVSVNLLFRGPSEEYQHSHFIEEKTEATKVI